MTFEDQMLVPRSVQDLPPHLVPPTIVIDEKEETAIGVPHSGLGLWYISGCDAMMLGLDRILSFHPQTNNEDIYQIITRNVDTGRFPGTSAKARGRQNLNLPVVAPKNSTLRSDAACQCALELQQQLQGVTSRLSQRMEHWLHLPAGSLQQAHSEGRTSSLRLLEYPPGIAVPPHTDASIYTLVYHPSEEVPLQIQDPQNDAVWYSLPHQGNEGCLYLLLGSHMDTAISNRFKFLGKRSSYQAPVHRLPASPISRRAMTLHVKVDVRLPSPMLLGNKSTCVTDLQLYDVKWDAHLFSCYLRDKYVPSVQSIRDHVRLVQMLVEGEDVLVEGGFGRYPLPSIHGSGYWQLQIQRYTIFLELHEKYPEEAKSILPPRIIHHVWVCHQLHPMKYRADCSQLVRQVLQHSNDRYNLLGCPGFHKLWRQHTGTEWPSSQSLYMEAQQAKQQNLAKHPEKLLDTKQLSAPLWNNLDSLERLYRDVLHGIPVWWLSSSQLSKTQDTKSKREAGLFEKVRLEYARYLVAAWYAGRVGKQVTPSAWIDLVWHCHQTDPSAYWQMNSDEFSTCPVDHVPCGTLNPVSAACGKQWLFMTDDIWKTLYDEGVPMQSLTIHCCTPIDSIPTNLVALNDHSVAFFFDSNRTQTSPASAVTLSRRTNVMTLARLLGTPPDPESQVERETAICEQILRPLGVALGKYLTNDARVYHRANIIVSIILIGFVSGWVFFPIYQDSMILVSLSVTTLMVGLAFCCLTERVRRRDTQDLEIELRSCRYLGIHVRLADSVEAPPSGIEGNSQYRGRAILFENIVWGIGASPIDSTAAGAAATIATTEAPNNVASDQHHDENEESSSSSSGEGEDLSSGENNAIEVIEV